MERARTLLAVYDLSHMFLTKNCYHSLTTALGFFVLFLLLVPAMWNFRRQKHPSIPWVSIQPKLRIAVGLLPVQLCYTSPSVNISKQHHLSQLFGQNDYLKIKPFIFHFQKQPFFMFFSDKQSAHMSFSPISARADASWNVKWSYSRPFGKSIQSAACPTQEDTWDLLKDQKVVTGKNS